MRVHVKKERAGQRVLTGITEFLQRRLKLRVTRFITGCCAYFALGMPADPTRK